VVVEGAVDESLGWVLDFSDIDKVVRPWVAQLDHQMLNEIDGLENPTSENLAGWLWSRVTKELGGVKEVSVSETPASRCVYAGD